MSEKKMSLKECNDSINELEEMLCILENKLNVKKFKVGRKDQVMEILKEGKLVSVSDIGKRLSITNRNVSTLLTYIRDDLDKKGIYGLIKLGKAVGKIKLVKLSEM